MALAGKSIAITGAGRGLGAALAIVAADRGMRPILLGRREAALTAPADAIAYRTGYRPKAIACDLADPGSVAAAASTIAEACPDLDVLVNSGSHWAGGAFEAMSDNESVDDERLSLTTSTFAAFPFSATTGSIVDFILPVRVIARGIPFPSDSIESCRVFAGVVGDTPRVASTIADVRVSLGGVWRAGGMTGSGGSGRLATVSTTGSST